MALLGPDTLPYRSCVGILLLNKEERIWLGRRFPGLISSEFIQRWQMPQGGIHKDEDPKLAALRELYEETGIRTVEIIGQSNGWVFYDLPPDAIGRAFKGKYRGQRQKWFAMRFLGPDEEINLHPEGQDPEFDAWRWATAKEALAEIVPFKRQAYEAVLKNFGHLVPE